MKRATLPRDDYFKQMVEYWLQAFAGDESMWADLLYVHQRLN